MKQPTIQTAILPCVICGENVSVNYIPSSIKEENNKILLDVHDHLFGYLYVHIQDNHFPSMVNYVGNS